MMEYKENDESDLDDGFPNDFDPAKYQIKATTAADKQHGDTQYHIDAVNLQTWDRRMKPNDMILSIGQIVSWFGKYEDEANTDKSFTGGTATIFKILSHNYYLALTCAHNLVEYDAIDKRRISAQRTWYFPKGSVYNKCRLQCVEIVIYDKYDASNPMCPNDLAIVLLHDKKGGESKVTAHFKDMKMNDSVVLDEWEGDMEVALNLWGYPTKSQGKLQGQNQRDAKVEDGVWKYERTLFTYPGHSGAALYERVREKKTYKYYVYGLHIFGDATVQKNCGILLDQNKLKWIESMADKLKETARHAVVVHVTVFKETEVKDTDSAKVEQWLKETVGLKTDVITVLFDEGYDNMVAIKSLEEEDLKEMKIKRGHRKQMMYYVEKLKQTEPLKVYKRPKDDDTIHKDIQERKVMCKFGPCELEVIKPSKGYPDKKTAKRAVAGKLKLIKVHGYNGNLEDSRQGIYLSHDGSFLIYHIAAVVVVFDYKKNTQTFFTKHNAEITTICLVPHKTWCATGQKHPRNEPGKAKDLPKIYVWNYKTFKTVQLLDNVCRRKVARVQWSSATNYLYCICGDEDQTLKAWDPKDFGQKGKDLEPLIKFNTMREVILGFEINPKPSSNNIDEILLFAKRKFTYCFIKKVFFAQRKFTSKIKSVSVFSLKKAGEKAFTCAQFLKNGHYIVGSSSGAIYVGKESTALAILQSAHDKAVDAMCMAADKLLTAGSDGTFKMWSIGECKDKNSGLSKTWECSLEVKDSNVVLQPRAIAYNNASGTVFCGTNTNQIVLFEMKSEESSVIVDGHRGPICALCTSPKENLFATGGYDNTIKIWNADTQKCIATYEFEITKDTPFRRYQFIRGHWSNDNDVLAFGTEDSNIALFTYRNKKLSFIAMTNIPEIRRVESVAYLRFNSDSTLLGATHNDSNLYIFTVSGLKSGKPSLKQWPPMVHAAAPINIQFTEDSTIVKTFNKDDEICYWALHLKAEKGKFLANQPDPDDTKWAGDPLIAGWDTQGLYQPGWDIMCLCDATLTADHRLIVSGDHYGCVRLHNYPAIDPSACLEYHSHSQYVTGVQFLRDDSQLITCGGNDMAIFQWQLMKD